MKRKVIMLLSVVALCVLFAGTALAENKDYVVDNADILTDSEEAELEQKAAEVSQRQGLDIVLLTVNSLEGKTVANYADDFYFFNGYGQAPSLYRGRPARIRSDDHGERASALSRGA